MKNRSKYNCKDCASLLGYGIPVHRRSGGVVCQLCGAGGGGCVDFDFWRQLTVEHLIGQSQGGDYKRIRRALSEKFPGITRDRLDKRAETLESINMVTACHFCNASTSRMQNSRPMERVIRDSGDTWQKVRASVSREAKTILRRKKTKVAWKLQAIPEGFDSLVKTDLERSRPNRAV